MSVEVVSGVALPVLERVGDEVLAACRYLHVLIVKSAQLPL